MLKRDKKFIYSLTVLLVFTIILGFTFLIFVSQSTDSYVAQRPQEGESGKVERSVPAKYVIGGQEEAYELEDVDTDFVLTEYMLDRPFKAPIEIFYDEFENEYQISDYKDNLVILYFWASWCVGCNQELKQLQQLNAALEYQKIHDLEIIPLSIDQKEVYELNSFYKSLGVDTLPIFHDNGRKFTDALKVKSLPTTFIIDKGGSIVAHIYDHLDWNNTQLTHELIELKGEDESHQKGQELIEKMEEYKKMKEKSDNGEGIDIMTTQSENKRPAKKKPIIIN